MAGSVATDLGRGVSEAPVPFVRSQRSGLLDCAFLRTDPGMKIKRQNRQKAK